MSGVNIRINEEAAAYLKEQAERLGLSLNAYVGQILDREMQHGPKFAERPVHLPAGLHPQADELEKAGRYFAVLYEGPKGIPTAAVVESKALGPMAWQVSLYGGPTMSIPRVLILSWVALGEANNAFAAGYLAVRQMAAWGAMVHPWMPPEYRERG